MSAFENERAYCFLKQRLETFVTCDFVSSNAYPWIFSLQEKPLISEPDYLTLLLIAQKYPCQVYETLYLAKMQNKEE
jgi:hypothetical protein